MPAGRLEVNVLDGMRLKDTQTFGKQDPYCVLRVGEQSDRTKTCRDGGTRPRWNERLNFTLQGHETAVNVEVWNANSMRSDSYIGAALVSLQDVFANGTQDATVPLRDKKNKIAGNIVLVLRFTELAAPAPVRVPQAHRVSSQDVPHVPPHVQPVHQPVHQPAHQPPVQQYPRSVVHQQLPPAQLYQYAAPVPLPTRPPFFGTHREQQGAREYPQTARVSPYPSAPETTEDERWFDDGPPPPRPAPGLLQPNVGGGGYAREMQPPRPSDDGWF
jgi:hypothetical protein